MIFWKWYDIRYHDISSNDMFITGQGLGQHGDLLLGKLRASTLQVRSVVNHLSCVPENLCFQGDCYAIFLSVMNWLFFLWQGLGSEEDWSSHPWSTKQLGLVFRWGLYSENCFQACCCVSWHWWEKIIVNWLNLLFLSGYAGSIKRWTHATFFLPPCYDVLW